MKTKIIAATLTSAFLLTACGGGGESSQKEDHYSPRIPTLPDPSDSSETDSRQPKANTGSVDAPFVKASAAGIFYTRPGLGARSLLKTAVQDANGVMTTLNWATLTGKYATQDIAGNINFAMGRWNVGTYSDIGGTHTMSGNSNDSVSYIVFNHLLSMPGEGTLTCESGNFTAPTYYRGSREVVPNAELYGTASGRGSITFDKNGAHFSLSLLTIGGTESSNETMVGTITEPTGMYVEPGYGNLEASRDAAIQMGENNGDGIRLILEYSVKMLSGRWYGGMATFVCR